MHAYGYVVSTCGDCAVLVLFCIILTSYLHHTYKHTNIHMCMAFLRAAKARACVWRETRALAGQFETRGRAGLKSPWPYDQDLTNLAKAARWRRADRSLAGGGGAAGGCIGKPAHSLSLAPLQPLQPRSYVHTRRAHWLSLALPLRGTECSVSTASVLAAYAGEAVSTPHSVAEGGRAARESVCFLSPVVFFSCRLWFR